MIPILHVPLDEYKYIQQKLFPFIQEVNKPREVLMMSLHIRTSYLLEHTFSVIRQWINVADKSFYNLLRMIQSRETVNDKYTLSRVDE